MSHSHSRCKHLLSTNPPRNDAVAEIATLSPLAAGLRSLPHLRYMPFAIWIEPDDQPVSLVHGHAPSTDAAALMRDAMHYLPVIRIANSLYNTKTVMMVNEDNDRRPILYERSLQNACLVSVIGKKLYNVYNILIEVEQDLSVMT